MRSRPSALGLALGLAVLAGPAAAATAATTAVASADALAAAAAALDERLCRASTGGALAAPAAGELAAWAAPELRPVEAALAALAGAAPAPSSSPAVDPDLDLDLDAAHYARPAREGVLAEEPALVRHAKAVLTRALFGEDAVLTPSGEAPPAEAGEAAGGEAGEAEAGAGGRRLSAKRVMIPLTDRSKLPGEYTLWVPEKDDLLPNNALEPYFLLLKLLDNVFLRWYLQDGKCDFKGPNAKAGAPPEAACTPPVVKLSYCLAFRINLPGVGALVQPVLPLCIPADLLDLLVNIGPTIGGIIEGVLDELSPYLLQAADEFVACGGNVNAIGDVLGTFLSSGAAAELGADLEGAGAAPAAGGDAAAGGALANVGALYGPVNAVLTNNNFIDFIVQLDWECFLLGPNKNSAVMGLLNTLLATDAVPAAFVPILQGLPGILEQFFSSPGCTVEKLLAWLDAVLAAVSTGQVDLSQGAGALGSLFGVTGTTRSGEPFGLSTRPASVITCVGINNLTLFLGVLGR